VGGPEPVGRSVGSRILFPLTAIVLITATDGYQVIFTLADTDPAFTDRVIILADRKDGKPLPEKEGPFRIVAPSEKRPARWIRNVKTIAIKNVEQ